MVVFTNEEDDSIDEVPSSSHRRRSRGLPIESPFATTTAEKQNASFI
jgi:hypothetical protein